ncbi:oxygenase MpaB family protein [Nocardia cyriacigeorgica]|uniref:oxygenase MpaB family protein n=1 Tax=Nocardia cyriacigeorgica TaxID=135487 RepID=UPI0024580AA9|nr:oxygenase MpaB family protein [Nocardia cyriacigeorgica]
MTAVAQSFEQHGLPPLTTEQTRIPIRSHHRPFTKRPLALTDALDFWSFGGAAANVVMQMARPGVGYGVAESRVESGALMVHPWKRARTTTQYLAVSILGTQEEKDAFREAVNVAHRQVRSGPDSSVKYNAFDRHLQLWVAACLFIGFEDTYQLLNGKMTDEQAEQFYQTSSPLATGLQVPREMWPATRKDFDAYWNEMAREAVLDDFVRGYLDDLLNLRMIHWYLRIPFRGLLKFLTIGFLAPYFREQLRVEWTDADQRRFDNLFLFVGFVNRFIPRFLRFGGSHALMTDLRRRIRKQKSLI